MQTAVNTDLKLNNFLEYIARVKSLDMTVEYAQENDGSITGHVFEFCTLDKAPTVEECEAKLIKGMRERAQFFAEDFQIFGPGRPYEIPYVFKILFSSDEELKSCLHGKICDDF